MIMKMDLVKRKSRVKKFCVTQCQVSRWIKNKENLMKDAASVHCKLFQKRRKATKHFNFYEKLLKKFTNAKAKGPVLNFDWS